MLYPLPSYHFLVEVGNLGAIRCARVSGLEWHFETLTYRDGLSFLDGERITKYHLKPFQTVTLEQGTVARDTKLLDWLRDTKTALLHSTGIQTLDIHLLDNERLPAVTWKFARAVATKLSGSDLDAQSNEVAIDRLEVQASGLRVLHA